MSIESRKVCLLQVYSTMNYKQKVRRRTCYGIDFLQYNFWNRIVMSKRSTFLNR